MKGGFEACRSNRCRDRMNGHWNKRVEEDLVECIFHGSHFDDPTF
jgi:hypothetical protein